jgi:hypothetical protein
MSVRKCELDQSQAKYVCTTHNVYYCEEHCKQHISDRRLHSILAIDYALTQAEFEKLQSETIKRIKYIEHIKHAVASQAAQLIANIEQTCIASIENLDHLIQAYRTYIAENNFNHKTLQKITRIINTRLEIQIDQELVLKFREESIIEEESESTIKLDIGEPGKVLNRERSSKHSAKQIMSDRIIRKYSKS